MTLTGSGFGARTAASGAEFRLPVAGAVAVPAEIETWSTTITVHVPPLTSFGSGGPLEVTVRTGSGTSDPPLEFVLLESRPPEVSSVTPARGLEGEEVAVVGGGFGRRAAGSAVAFRAPGPADVAAEVVSWQPQEVRVRIPPLTQLRGAGARPVVLRTPWGTSEPVEFTVGQLPAIHTVEPESVSPGGRVTVSGTAFGPPEDGQLRLLSVPDEDGGSAPGYVVHPLVLAWTDEVIEAEIPPFTVLRTTGRKDVVVETTWGASEPVRILVETRASITSWTRIEPHARTDDLEAGLNLGLQAQTYDGLWLLGRQWQMLELRGEDAGSPVRVAVDGRVDPLSRWRPGAGSAADVTPRLPLEALVEREHVLPPPGTPSPFSDMRLAAEVGLQFLRHLTARLRDPRRADDYRKRYLAEFGLAPAGEELDPVSRRFLAVAEGRAPDGARLYSELATALPPRRELPRKPPIDGNDRDAVLAAIADWYGWCGALFSSGIDGEPAWDPERMEYRFQVAAGDTVLEAREHGGGPLDWYSFVRSLDGDSLGSPPPGREEAPFRRVVVPSLVTFPGMPAPRWWEFEDARVDFGAVTAAPNELVKLLFVEFATVYGNDWFVVPVEGLDIGSICRIQSVVVTDSFGFEIEVSPFGEGAGRDWAMFELAAADGTEEARDLLLLPDALPTTLESSPLEEVLLFRDELANLAWGVERVVEGPTGRPLNRLEALQDRRRRDELTAGGVTDAPGSIRRYRLMTSVPDYWVAFARTFDAAHGHAMLAKSPLAQPRGRLLEPGGPFTLYDEEVPRAGSRVARVWQRGRGPDGATHLWRARRKGAGRGEGSSGLQFDRSDPELQP